MIGLRRSGEVKRRGEEIQDPILPETNIALAPDNGCLEDDCFLLGWHNLAGAIAVSFREGTPYQTLGAPPQKKNLTAIIYQDLYHNHQKGICYPKVCFGQDLGFLPQLQGWSNKSQRTYESHKTKTTTKDSAHMLNGYSSINHKKCLELAWKNVFFPTKTPENCRPSWLFFNAPLVIQPTLQLQPPVLLWCTEGYGRGMVALLSSLSVSLFTHWIHVWYIYIYLHLVDFYGKCR